MEKRYEVVAARDMQVGDRVPLKVGPPPETHTLVFIGAQRYEGLPYNRRAVFQRPDGTFYAHFLRDEFHYFVVEREVADVSA